MNEGPKVNVSVSFFWLAFAMIVIWFYNANDHTEPLGVAVVHYLEKK